MAKEDPRSWTTADVLVWAAEQNVDAEVMNALRDNDIDGQFCCKRLLLQY
jgi:hypothetical protein